MIELSDVKYQLRIEQDDSTEDAYLNMLVRAVQSYVDTYLNRLVQWERRSRGTDTEIPMYDDIKIACLMLIGTWYENRESVSAFTLKEVPMATEMLLSPYRIQQSGFLEAEDINETA